jgi:putative acetyltransferase
MNKIVLISIETPDQPGVIRLIEAGDALSASLYPPESSHMLALDALLEPNVTFLVARTADAVVGCAALVRMSGYGEIKRMFVDEAARGQGIARRLLEAIEMVARTDGLAALKLETGIYQPAALALYRAAGFREVPPFGDYKPDPLSVFMSKALG